MFLARGRYQAGQLDSQGAVVAIEDPREQPMEGLMPLISLTWILDHT